MLRCRYPNRWYKINPYYSQLLGIYFLTYWTDTHSEKGLCVTCVSRGSRVLQQLSATSLEKVGCSRRLNKMSKPVTFHAALPALSLWASQIAGFTSICIQQLCFFVPKSPAFFTQREWSPTNNTPSVYQQLWQHTDTKASATCLSPNL